MSEETWAIIGGAAAIIFAIGILGSEIEKRLDRIANILFDIKQGRRD